MKRKRFIKIAMSQGCSKREATYAAEYTRITCTSYAEGFNAMSQWIGGRFSDYATSPDLSSYKSYHKPPKHEGLKVLFL